MQKIIKRQPKQIEPDELKKIRSFFHEKQNKGFCPILKEKFYSVEMVVDHAHVSNSKNLGREFEAGLIRGVIHRQANTMEGKITNSFIRCGLHKMDITLPEFLRNLADFIEHPPMTNLKYKHPSEKQKKPILLKRNWKKLAKLYSEKYPNRKQLKYHMKYYKNKNPKSIQKLTQTLKKLYLEFNIEPEFYT